MGHFFIYFGYLILIVNFILYTKSFSKFGKAFNVFVSYLLLLVIVQLIMEFLLLFSIPNLFLTHFYFIGQLVLLGFFYHTLLKNILFKKIIIAGTSLSLIILLIQYFIDPSLFFKFNLLEITITSLLVVGFAFFYLYELLTREKKFYYVTIGLIIYLLTSTVLFLIGNITIVLANDLRFFSWTLNAFLVLVNQFFILYEWKVSFSKKSIENKII